MPRREKRVEIRKMLNDVVLRKNELALSRLTEMLNDGTLIYDGETEQYLLPDGSPIGGGDGESVLMWRPTISENGDISWSKSSSQTAPSVQNIKGKDGSPGIGIPEGGSAGQILAKKSDTNYDTEWTEIEVGKQFNWRGPFQLGNMYNINDVVIGSDGNDYIAIMDGIVLPPPSMGWDLFLQGNEINVVQVLGDSTTDVISQAGITKILTNMITLLPDESIDISYRIDLRARLEQDFVLRLNVLEDSTLAIFDDLAHYIYKDAVAGVDIFYLDFVWQDDGNSGYWIYNPSDWEHIIYVNAEFESDYQFLFSIKNTGTNKVSFIASVI